MNYFFFNRLNEMELYDNRDGLRLERKSIWKHKSLLSESRIDNTIYHFLNLRDSCLQQKWNSSY